MCMCVLSQFTVNYSHPTKALDLTPSDCFSPLLLRRSLAPFHLPLSLLFITIL